MAQRGKPMCNVSHSHNGSRINCRKKDVKTHGGSNISVQILYEKTKNMHVQ